MKQLQLSERFFLAARALAYDKLFGKKITSTILYSVSSQATHSLLKDIRYPHYPMECVVKTCTNGMGPMVSNNLWTIL